jgi:hypothetical protein
MDASTFGDLMFSYPGINHDAFTEAVVYSSPCIDPATFIIELENGDTYRITITKDEN